MNLATLFERYGESVALAIGGLVIGILFGFFAQRSKFCLRAAAIEFWHRKFGEKLSVWLLAFSSAVVGVQLLILTQSLDVSAARQIAARGSLSGALIGGLLFGAGMIMTRGCASRLLILSANGNLRALLSGLIFAVTAQASLSGSLAPLRNAISAWWTVDGGPSRDLLAITGAGHWGGLLFGLVWLAAALFFSVRSGWGLWKWIGGIGAGLMVAAGWALAEQGAPAAYAAEEAAARRQRRGAWRGEVPSGAVPPWRAAGDAVAPAPVPPVGLDCVLGTVEATGIEVGCPEFRGADGRLYALLGATARGLGAGASACVCGEPAAVSICMRGQALVARWVGPPAACAGR